MSPATSKKDRELIHSPPSAQVSVLSMERLIGQQWSAAECTRHGGELDVRCSALLRARSLDSLSDGAFNVYLQRNLYTYGGLHANEYSDRRYPDG